MTAKPTLLGQGISALTALILIGLLTRNLTEASYGVYAAVFATYTFGNALVGTTIGTRGIAALSTGTTDRLRLAVWRDAAPITLCCVGAAGAVLLAEPWPGAAAAAALGMFLTIIGESANSQLFGVGRYWTYVAIALLRMAVWLGLSVLALATLPTAEKLTGVILAAGAGAAVPLAYGVAARTLHFDRGHFGELRHAISAVGLANLSLWLLASADRVILAHYALAALASYAAIYGLFDRTFRTVANAEIQYRLPEGFRRHMRRERAQILLTRVETAAVMGLGVLCALLGPTAVAVISGGRYKPPLLMSAVLSAAMIAMIAAVPAYISLLSSDNGRSAAVVATLAATINVVGNLALASQYGTASATALTLVGYLVWLVGVVYCADRVRRRHDVARAGASP